MRLKIKFMLLLQTKPSIAKHGEYLSNLSVKNKVNLEFEASVGGGIPILRTIKEGPATNKIHKIYGILNGTCNYILTEMEKTGLLFKICTKKSSRSWLCITRKSKIRFKWLRYSCKSKNSFCFSI